MSEPLLMGAWSDLEGMADMVVFQQGGKLSVGIQETVLIPAGNIDLRKFGMFFYQLLYKHLGVPVAV